MDLFKRDQSFEHKIAAPSDWNHYLFIALKFILTFTIFSLLMEEYVFFIHHDQAWVMLDFLLIAFYVLIIVIALIQMVKQLPMAAVMLAAPTIPLLMLLLILLGLPFLHFLHKVFQ
jgi:hypothetical protein